MKNISRIAFVLTALVLSLILCLAAFAETVEPETPELPAIEDAAPAEDAATSDASAAGSTTADTALRDALNAYRSAKQSSRVENIENELKEYVAAGKLTQEQADLILKYYKDRAALQSGTCPNCGYQFSNGGHNGKGMRGGRGGRGGKGMRGGRGGFGYSAQSGSVQGGATQSDGAASGTAFEDMWTGMVSLDGIEEDI